MNRKCHIDFTQLKKKNVGEEAIDLVKKMLTRESKTRISASDALKHPYFNQDHEKIDCEEEYFSNKISFVDECMKINTLVNR